MKKSLICLALAASVASVNVQAQEQTGGNGSSTVAAGGINTPVVAAGYVATAIVAGLVVNSSANSPARPAVIDPPPVDPPVLTCSGDDELVDGVCINTTVTTTVTTTGVGTNTGTATVGVTVTSGSAPTS